MEMETNLTWHLYMLPNEGEIAKAIESFKSRHGGLPTRAKVSTKCPPELEEAIKKALEPMGITIEKTTYALPLDLWLTNGNGSKPLQMTLIALPEESNGRSRTRKSHQSGN